MLLKEITELEAKIVSASSIEELAATLRSSYELIAPVVKTEDFYSPEEPQEVSKQIRTTDVFGDPVNRSQNYLHFKVHVPVEGNASLLWVKPTNCRVQYGADEPEMSITNGEIVLSYQILVSDALDPQAIIQRDLGNIKFNAEALGRDIDVYNKNIQQPILQHLQKRKEAVDKSQGIISKMDIPIKRRSDIPATYEIPTVRKKSPVVTSTQKITSVKRAEPTLAVAEYEYILTIMKDMAIAMERNPSTFSRLDEEEIRDFFLILLNGHYQGNATGETFNGIGKTDILIRHEGQNAFIGECKIWRGEKVLKDTLDQLFGYITWRDTKTAVIIFSRNKDLTSVVLKARAVIEQHSGYKEDHQPSDAKLQESETVFCYKLAHPEDKEKEMFLTLMVFQVPESLEK